MSIHIHEDVVGIWFLGYGTDDLLMHLEKAGDNFKLTYRFRYYRDDKTHDSQDIKNWYEAILSGETEESVIEHMHRVINLAAKVRKPDEYHELLMSNKTVDQFMEEFMKLPFVHAKTVDKEEFEKEHPELRMH